MRRSNNIEHYDALYNFEKWAKDKPNIAQLESVEDENFLVVSGCQVVKSNSNRLYRKPEYAGLDLNDPIDDLLTKPAKAFSSILHYCTKVSGFDPSKKGDSTQARKFEEYVSKIYYCPILFLNFYKTQEICFEEKNYSDFINRVSGLFDNVSKGSFDLLISDIKSLADIATSSKNQLERQTLFTSNYASDDNLSIDVLNTSMEFKYEKSSGKNAPSASYSSKISIQHLRARFETEVFDSDWASKILKLGSHSWDEWVDSMSNNESSGNAKIARAKRCYD